MPYFISNKAALDERNAFSKKCGNAGFVPVICMIVGRKADIRVDFHDLADEHNNIRQIIMTDDSAVAEIVEAVFKRFDPKAKSWSFGYYSAILGVNADIAQEMSAILAGELDAYIMRLRRCPETL